MAKEKPPRKQAKDKSIRQPHHTMARPPAVFTVIHDKFIYGRSSLAGPTAPEIRIWFSEDGDNVPPRSPR